MFKIVGISAVCVTLILLFALPVSATVVSQDDGAMALGPWPSPWKTPAELGPWPSPWKKPVELGPWPSPWKKPVELGPWPSPWKKPVS